MLNKNIETFIGCDADYETSRIVIFGAPFDSTTSFRPGARFGCSAIRKESFGIETYSPYQDKDLLDYCIFDAGDVELPFGSPADAIKKITEVTDEILNDGKFPLMVGGEHLVTFGAFRSIVKKYPNVHIIQFDAHADLRKDYLGVELSHACVMRRCHDIVGDGKISQFGIRSGEREEFEFACDHTYMHKFSLKDVPSVVNELEKSNCPVYFTLDLDVLDPSCFCGTGTPEAGGVSFNELLEAIKFIGKLNVVGADINELAPMLDASGSSTAMACKVLREILLALND